MDSLQTLRMNSSTDTTEIYEWEGLEPVPTKYAFSGMILTVVFFQILNKIVSGSNANNEKFDANVWKWRNLYVSWIHAVICGGWDISCFLLYPELMQDLVAYHNMHIYSMICFSTGYFFYDSMDIVLNNMSGKMWEVLVHHAAVGGVFFYNLLMSRCLAYNVIALTVEVNTTFLHARKLLQMSQIDYSSLLYRIVKWTNLITFVLFRFGALIVIFYGMYIWAHRVSGSYYVVLSMSCFVMSVINCVLFKRLVKSDVLRGNHSGTKAASNGSVHNGTAVANGKATTNNNEEEVKCTQKEESD